VRQILEAYEDVAGFCSPDVCFHDARKYIPDLSERRGFDPAVGLSVLEKIGRMVEPVDRCSRPGRLADSRGGSIARFPDLDRGSRFLWQRCRYLDHG
jgi:hypothetical protein